jgi:hypothetical protein
MKKRSKIKLCISFSIAVFVIGFYFLYNSSVSSATIPDCATISGNLIQNCGFEGQDPLPVSPGNMIPLFGGGAVQTGYTGLTDWTILSPVLNSNVAIFPLVGNVPQGNRTIDISGVKDVDPLIQGEKPGSGVEQTVTGLTIGKTYDLTFYQSISPVGATPSEVTLLLDGVSQGTYIITTSTPGELVGSWTWVKQSFSFVATNTFATLTFRSDFDDVARGIFAATSDIDNISLVVDPDPTVILSTPSTTVNAPFTVTITPSELITDLTLGDLSISNGIASDLVGSGIGPYMVTITPTVPSGVITITLPAATVVDSVGNPNTVSNTLNVTYDTSSPQITSIHIESNNSNPAYATVGNIITLDYTLDVIPTTGNTVVLGGQSVTPICSGIAPAYMCSAALIVTTTIPTVDGVISFTITASSAPVTHSATGTTDGSSVTVDRNGPVVTITGPLGTTPAGSNTITGTCDASISTVTINGNGFTPSSGTTTCSGGSYSYPITITGNTVFTVSQTDTIGNIGSATGSTSLPAGITAGGGSSSSGGCIYSTGCNGVHLDFTTTTTPVTTNIPAPLVTEPKTECPKFTQYLKKGNRDGSNGITEVSKVQNFLNKHFGANISVDGVFGTETYRAVNDFQSTYFSNILLPWKLSHPTGWWYESTRHFANFIESCPEGITRLDNGVSILNGVIISN